MWWVVLALGCLTAAVSPAEAVSLASLQRALEVSTTVGDGSASNVARAGTDELFISWKLNASAAAGIDAGSFRDVELRLCFAGVSQVDRPWRKTNEGDLSKDKSCAYDIATLPFNSSSSAPYAWTVTKSVPAGEYFVRAYVADAAGTKLAYGQSPAVGNSGTFSVKPITGRHPSIDIAAAVFSAFSVVSLFGFYFFERKIRGK